MQDSGKLLKNPYYLSKDISGQSPMEMVVVETTFAQKPLQGCVLGCSCEKCLALGYTQVLALQNNETFVFGGPIMIKLPVSNYHQMVGHINLTYKSFHSFLLPDILKLKHTFTNFLPGLAKIYLTLRPDQRKEEIIVNTNDTVFWFINIIRAKLYASNRFGVPYRKYEGKIIGKVWVKRFLLGWVSTKIQISDRLRIDGQSEIKSIRQFWTRFQLIDVEGLCLVVKFWDFLSKWEIGIPLRELALWLTAFLSLIKD